ncbi:MAG: GIY-YIG nuclease family protein [Metamycoplasmataceae bacterium]
MKKEILNNIPKNNGVYIFKDKNENIIYVGKAKNLNDRVKQYFKGTINSYKTSKMVSLINSIDFFITKNEKDALILERNLIEKHKPNYNVLLLDDKKYPYINIALKKELEISIKYIYKPEKNSLFFGPFPRGFNFKNILNLLISECFFENGLPINKKEKSRQFWEEKYDFCKKILNSDKSYISFLKTLMNKASEKELYEIANEYKKIINFLENKNEHQLIQLNKNQNIDVIAIEKEETYFYIFIEIYRFGFLVDKKSIVIEISIDESEAIRQFINQYYKNTKKPDKIISNYLKNDLDIYFDIEVINPKKGINKKILNICLENNLKNKNIAKLNYKNNKNKNEKAWNYLKDLASIKELNSFLMVDNSHINNINPVSVFISYKNGMRYPEGYRNFKIDLESFDKKSDIFYLEKGITKYFLNKNNYIPDLLIIDGSVAQLNIAKKIIKKIKINIPVIAFSKDEKHKTKFSINTNGKKSKIIDREIYNYILEIQNEVDRYAKSVFRKKDTLSSMEGKLLQIKGIGLKTEEKILKYFGTYNAIYNASYDDLKKVVSEEIARKIKEHIN